MKTLMSKEAKSFPQNLADTSKLGETVSFSFQFFRQIEYFGLGKCDKEWYLLLIKALSDLSHMTCNELFNNKKQLRYHKIKWEQPNIPLQPEDFDWIPSSCRERLWQIYITTANGRIVGFVDNNVFHIVLLDPEHNIQPCKERKYALTTTTIKESNIFDTYNNLKIQYYELIELIHAGKTDEIDKIIASHHNEKRHIVYATFDNEEDYQWYIDTTGDIPLKELVEDYLVIKNDININ